MLRAILLTAILFITGVTVAQTDVMQINSTDGFPIMNNVDSMPKMVRDRISLDNALIDFEHQRPFYNHAFIFTSGASINTMRMNNSMSNYNDTSEHQFTVNGHSPIFSFTYEMAVDSTFGLSYTIGYSNSNILFDNKYYGTRQFFLSVNPQVFISRSYNFETYFRLKIGVAYLDNRLSENPSEILKRVYQTGFHMFTGIAFGVNYLVSDHLALSAALSLWSPETVNFGISYRFFHVRDKKTPDFMSSNY